MNYKQSPCHNVYGAHDDELRVISEQLHIVREEAKRVNQVCIKFLMDQSVSLPT